MLLTHVMSNTEAVTTKTKSELGWELRTSTSQFNIECVRESWVLNRNWLNLFNISIQAWMY